LLFARPTHPTRQIVDDAAKFITAEGHDTYDVIIVDSSDPVGPAEALFKPEFFMACQQVYESERVARESIRVPASFMTPSLSLNPCCGHQRTGIV
jgi:predicted membrane-bound spermidine synthase